MRPCSTPPPQTPTWTVTLLLWWGSNVHHISCCELHIFLFKQIRVSSNDLKSPVGESSKTSEELELLTVAERPLIEFGADTWSRYLQTIQYYCNLMIIITIIFNGRYAIIKMSCNVTLLEPSSWWTLPCWSGQRGDQELEDNDPSLAGCEPTW